MAFTVFPERMDKLDLENTEQSLAVLENFLNYMQERVEFSFTNMFKVVQGAGTSTAELLILIASLSNSLSSVTSQVNQLSGSVTSLQTTVGGHTTELGDLDDRLDVVEAILTGAGPICYIQPQDVTVEVGESFTLSVKVLGASSFKWEHYYSSSWIEPGWDGHDTDTMTIPSTSVTNILNNRQIRCTITGDGWTIYSRIATVHVTST